MPHLGCINLKDTQKLVGRGWSIFNSPVTEKISLEMTSRNGTNPLMVGFYLNGSSIDDRKYWYFGNGVTDGWTNSIVENQEYSIVNKTEHTYRGYINMTDSNGGRMPSIQFNVTVMPNRDPVISNFDQTEGTIYQDDSVGLDFASSVPVPSYCYITHRPCILWKFGDSPSTFETPNENQPNPFHKYEHAGRRDGILTVENDSTKGNYVSYHTWDFSVITLNTSATSQNPRIEEATAFLTPTLGKDDWPANKSLLFQIANEPPTEWYLDYLWNFGDNTTAKTNDNSIEHPYFKNGTYVVNVTITGTLDGQTTYNNTLVKTIHICPNPTNAEICNP